MKCTACGLPLSPSRNNANCPRCGTPAIGGTKSTAGPVNFEPTAWGGNPGVPLIVSAPPQDRQWEWERATPPSAFQSHTPMPQPGQIWTTGPNGTQRQLSPFSSQPPQPPSRRPPRNSRAGFMIAGICVLTGGILLIFVYFMAMGQSGNTSTAGTPVSTRAVSSPTATPSPASSPSPTATTYPGQQYINNAQMSSVQPSATQPAQPGTTFKVNQKLYVVFNITSAGHSGAICLTWYFNGKAVFNFAFAVGAHTTSSYAYATYGTPGPAYVELYWASSAACTDEVLAQHVDFTITT